MERKMMITIETRPYNTRREGRPWICRITAWPTGKDRPEIAWGQWIASAGDGSAGELRIEANLGDLIRRGQKDHRKPHQSDDRWCAVEADGSLRDIDGKVAALHYWESHTAAPAPVANANPLVAYSDAEIAAEYERRGLSHQSQ
jgi:hypothetical protein